jgi:hypothetical protein
MKRTVIVGGLLLVLLANILMMYCRPNGLYSLENFKSHSNYGTAPKNKEGFSGNLLQPGGTGTTYSPMGQFDGVKLSTGNTVSSWRYTAPNESLTGAEFQPGDNELFMFKNNQCKPECCGASFSCGGGCVCTTPQQRQYIAARGGNRTQPEDSI